MLYLLYYYRQFYLQKHVYLLNKPQAHNIKIFLNVLVFSMNFDWPSMNQWAKCN